MNKLEKFLIDELEYEQYEVEIIIEDIQNLDEESQDIIEKYIDGKCVKNYSYKDYSVERLMNEKGFNTIASIISIGNLKRDYDKYSELYKKPIK